MSFFKKLKAELKEMLNDDDKDKKKDESGAQIHDQTEDVHNQPAPNTYGQSQQQNPYLQYGNAAPPSGPQHPPGWISQWDENSQRKYYLEQATGRTQWEPPTWQGGSPAPPPGGPGYYQSYGNAMPPGMPYQQGHNEHQREYYGGVQPQEKKGSGMGKVVAAGVGGAAVGALAANAFDDSDDEYHAAPAAAPYGYGATPAAAPVPLEDNPELSSSQRSSLEEAREDLEDAQEKVAEEGSDASSSDLEDLQEAREEYHSEVEDAEEELED